MCVPLNRSAEIVAMGASNGRTGVFLSVNDPSNDETKKFPPVTPAELLFVP